MDNKSPDAFRTISEVADWLGVPTHVLRFWESRFSQVKPVKRAGGRRYYRPTDMALLGGIRKLLHDDGMTIRGVQKLLREEGIKHVSGFSQPLDLREARDVTPTNVVPMAPQPEPEPAPVVEEAEIATPPVEAGPEIAAPPETTPEPTPEPAPAEVAASAPAHETAEETTGDLMDSPEGLDFLAHDADIAPPEPDAPAKPDLSHIPADPGDEEGTAPAPSVAASIRRARGGDISAPAPQLQALADRLQALSDRMASSRDARRPH